MFNAIFCKSIWNGETSDEATSVAIFNREEVLPFAPMPGMDFFWGHDLPIGPLKVRWNTKDGNFVCDMPDEFPHSVGSHDITFDWLVQNATKTGWTLIAETAMELKKSFWEETP